MGPRAQPRRAGVGSRARVGDGYLHRQPVHGELLRYLVHVDAASESRALAWLAPLAGDALEREQREGSARRARAGLVAVRDRLEARRDAYVDVAGLAAWRAARRLAWLAERRVELAMRYDMNPASPERDRVMAENVLWIRGEAADGCVVVLAHNSHVGRTPGRMANGRISQGSTMGAHLARRLGDRYVVIHPTVGEGTFRAHRGTTTISESPWMRARGLAPLAVFAMPPVRSGTVEFDLQGVDAPFVLDLRRLPARGDATHYFAAEHGMRELIGAWRSRWSRLSIGCSGLVPVDDFDVLVYLPRDSATTPL